MNEINNWKYEGGLATIIKKTCMLLLAMALLLTPINVLPVHADEASNDFYYIENSDTTSVTITGYTDTAPRDHVVIPSEINGKTVTAIGNEAFQNKSIQSLELPDGLISIGNRAFFNNLFTSLEIPASVKRIGDIAFAKNDLESLTLHDGVESIGISAFAENNLTTLNLPDSVTEIKDSAFFGNRINSLVLPNQLVEIGDNNFYGNKLTSIDIPESVQVIGSSAFSGNRIEELVIPATVTDLKSNAFHYNALESVTFLGTPSLADASVFSNQFSDSTNSDLYHWYTDTDYTEDWDSTVTSPMTIYAAWKSNFITFETDGGSGVGRKTVDFGQKTTAPTSTKSEHTFAGWYKEPELINQWDFNTDIVIRNITLYAKWTTNGYTVSFQSNGGSAVDSQSIVYDGKVVEPENPSKAGHTFEGWYTADLTTKWNFDTNLVKRDTTLYAKWTANTYNVSFQTNGGTLINAQTIAHDNKVVPPAGTQKPGHTFAGWYTDSDLTTAWDFTTDLVKGDMTLYAKWTANIYTVTFQSNGGTAVDTQSIAYYNKVVLPVNPSKAEHTFVGWYTDSNLTAPWYFDTGVVTRNMTLYAKWTANTYTVSFQSNGGSAVAAQTIGHDGKVAAPVNPSKVGHTFAGWYTDSKLTTAWNFGTGQVKENMTLYAKWTVNTYTVSFQSNGGSAVAAQKIAHDGKVAAPATPSKAGYTFVGWYTDTKLTTPWNFTTGQVKGNMTLYAKWTANTYTVSFHSNGGTAVAAQTITHDDKVAAPAGPSKAGHTFGGWYTDTKLTTAWNFSTGQVKADMTLYAKWTANTYTVSFQSNGGSAVAAQTITHDGKVVAPATPSKAGNTFAGWYTDTKLTTSWNFATGLVKEEMTLYAKWTANVYTVSFQSNGGTAVAAQTIVHDDKVVAPANPSKAGHTFEGWYTDTKLTTAWNFGTGQVKADMTLYAKWTANTYTVSFQSNGGSAVAAQTIAHDGKIVLPATPSKAGHTFGGWYIDTKLTTAWNFGTGLVKENMTLYAKWTANTYNVSFQSNGGTAVAAQTIVHDGKVTAPATPSKAGQTFAGWYTDTKLTTAWNFATGLVKENMTLYAKWTANKYTVSFHSNGGTAVAAQTIVHDGKVVAPANPSKAGQTFAGWYTDTKLTTAWNFGTGQVKADMMLYAKWTVNAYMVSFHSNGGTVVAAQTITHDGKVVAPATPSKAGHTFAGWYTDTKLTTAWNFATGLVKADMTLYAKWTANTYTVSFQSNGGSAVAAQEIAHDGKVVAPANPSKAGQTFAGWYTDTKLTTAWNFATGLVKENMTLYAKWTANKYTVSFQSNGGSAVAAQTIVHDGKVAAPSTPSKAGHTFEGWYTDTKLTTAWNFATGLVKENMTLYAKWTANKYTVSFQSNGGSAVAAQEIAHNGKVAAPAKPRRSGYTFVGWFKNEDLKLVWNFTTDVVTADMTLYAKWSKVIHIPTPDPVEEQEPNVEPEPIPEEEPVQNICSTDFSDTSNHWAEDAITDIASRCIIIGYPDGEFKPNAPLIRSHVAVMLTRALDLAPYRPLNSYNDVSTENPYYEAIMKVSQAGIFEGTNGSFYPDQQLTRAEMAKILVLSFNLPIGGKSTFPDVSETHWASSYIAALESYGLAFGEGGEYKPDEPVTRAQFVAFMYRAIRL